MLTRSLDTNDARVSSKLLAGLDLAYFCNGFTRNLPDPVFRQNSCVPLSLSLSLSLSFSLYIICIIYIYRRLGGVSSPLGRPPEPGNYFVSCICLRGVGA